MIAPAGMRAGESPPAPETLGAQLLWAQRMESLAAICGGLAHALGNVLASTLLSIDVLGQPGCSEDKRQRLLASLEGISREGLAMVRQVLWLARGVPERPGMAGEPILFQPQYLIAEAQKLTAATFPRSLRVVTRHPHDLALLAGEPLCFFQLLLALCLDARDQLPEGGTIVLTASNGGASPADPSPAGFVTIEVLAIPDESAKDNPPPATAAPPPATCGVNRSAIALAAALGGSCERLPAGMPGAGFRLRLPAAGSEVEHQAAI